MASDVANLQRSYCQEILRFRKVLNLTSIDSMEGLIEGFIRPSVLLQQWVPEGAKLLDIGSGMGVPGIPLLLHRQDTSGVLVDRRLKRSEFLRHVVRKFGLDCVVHCCDARVLPIDQSIDVVVARAVANPVELLTISAPFVRVGGIAILPTGQSVVCQEVDGWCVLEDSGLQFGNDLRQRVLRYRRL